MVAEVYLPPLTTRGTWVPMSPGQVNPGSPLKPEKKGDIQKEGCIRTWGTWSPFLKEHVEGNFIFESLGRNGRSHKLEQPLKD